MIISHINTKYAGFFSSFLFMVNHYIYAKLNKQGFQLITDNWLFKYKKGWEDYFLSIDFPTKTSESIQDIIIQNHPTVLGQFPWKIYRSIILDIYKYNLETQTKINDSKKILNWNPSEYATIFIRRGDKLIEESLIIPAEHYLIFLLELYPECNKVYLQTDDYNVFLELKEFQHKHHEQLKHIDIRTFCKEKFRGGMVITKEYYNYCRDNNIQEKIKTIPISQNQNYLRENLESLQKCKPLEMQTPDEIYQHTMDMLIGIDMVFHGRFCITDYQSNITRFIKLGHPNIDSVYDIIQRNNIIDLYSMGCPGYNCFYR